MQETLTNAIKLGRWRDHLPFTIALTLLGALLTHVSIDWHLGALLAANVLAVAYAFMLNDIEDAPDDAADPHRVQTNVIASGALPTKTGMVAAFFVAAGAAGLYLVGGQPGIGILMLGLAHFYSWHPVRLKAWPLVDVASHALMLGGVLVLSGAYLGPGTPNVAWWVVLGMTLISAYGQLYNQIRDMRADRHAGLRTTALLLGEKWATRLMFGLAASGGICLIVAAFMGAFPGWLLILGGLIAIAGWLLRPNTDARGTPANVTSGRAQTVGYLLVNAMVLIWLVARLI